MVLILRPGDSIPDWSTFNLVQGDEEGRALLTDKWGIYYVADENDTVEFAGHNAINAEVTYLFPQFSLEEDA